jgi:hypothetical protein
MASPPEEQTWKLALFGNPKPNDMGGPAVSWFFWPRSPALVEMLVEQEKGTKSYIEREFACTFHGKIENKVQEKNRQKEAWYQVCDDYSMALGADKPYKLSHSEYLLRLANSRFGLCLAGYGKKCHREVECMAMGCVPVCATEVDINKYANPPQEGLHYIRVKSPEETREKLKAISKEEWETMSNACRAWWSENASVRGSWALTQKLKVSM